MSSVTPSFLSSSTSIFLCSLFTKDKDDKEADDEARGVDGPSLDRMVVDDDDEEEEDKDRDWRALVGTFPELLTNSLFLF